MTCGISMDIHALMRRIAHEPQLFSFFFDTVLWINVTSPLQTKNAWKNIGQILIILGILGFPFGHLCVKIYPVIEVLAGLHLGT